MRQPSPAVLILLQAGITGRQLAGELDLTPQAVSWQLAGRAAETSEDLLDAIEQVAREAHGEDAADELRGKVARAIDAERARLTAEGSRR